MTDVAVAFVVVFLAELGDKTQLVALTLAGRHPAMRVLLALGAAIAVLQTLSVTVGALVSEAAPESPSSWPLVLSSWASLCGRGARRRTRRSTPDQRGAACSA